MVASSSNQIGSPDGVNSSGVPLTAEDAELLPTEFVAVTVQLYACPLVSPVTLIGELSPDTLTPPQVAV